MINLSDYLNLFYIEIFCYKWFILNKSILILLKLFTLFYLYTLILNQNKSRPIYNNNNMSIIMVIIIYLILLNNL